MKLNRLLLGLMMLGCAPGLLLAGKGHAQKSPGCGVAQKFPGCGCGPTQKGPTQKGPAQKGPAQKGPAQKGLLHKGIVQKSHGCGCGVTQKGHRQKCDGHAQKPKGPAQKHHGVAQKSACGKKGCHACGPLVPAVLQGLDSLLNNIFRCSRCCDTACGSCKVPDYVPDAPPNPFLDDEEDLRPPPIPAVEARHPRGWNIHNNYYRPASMSQAYGRFDLQRRLNVRPGAPRELPAADAAPLEKEQVTEVREQREAPPAVVVRTSNVAPSTLRIPHNPLRGQ